jgi:hypothetical protein
VKSFVFLLTLATSSAFAATPLNSSIIMFHEPDYDACAGKIPQIVALGNKRVLLNPALHFLRDSQEKMAGYCLHRGSGNCEEFSPELIRILETHWTKCIAAVAQAGLDLSIIPHLNDGASAGFWRNGLIFDPLAKYNGYSYWEVVISPLARAILAGAGAAIKVEFSLQGEMGATVFNHPESYSKIVNELKLMFQSRPVKLGLSFNYNKISGRYPTLLRRKTAETQHLLGQLDFFGISAYHPVSTPPVPMDFERSIDSVIGELKQLGLSIPAVPINFSESGIGGGTKKNDGITPAANPREAAEAPYAGVYSFGPTTNPWTSPDMQEFRYRYHAALLEFLSVQTESGRMGNAFLWNSNSWDPQGIYGSGDFKDERIIDLIRNYNHIAELQMKGTP